MHDPGLNFDLGEDIDSLRSAIQDFADGLKRHGRTLLLCGAPSQPTRLMENAEFHRHIGNGNILTSVDAALQRAEEIWRDRVSDGK